MSLQVLIVDDSKTIRAMIGKALRIAKISDSAIFEAENGKQALELLADQWIDLILADINMPVMNGIELVQALKANELTASIPVVVVSTEGSQERIDMLEELGVHGYLRKPFQPEQLRDLVADLMGDEHGK